MWQLILGTAGFVLYFVYDINSILSKNVCLQKFFALGSILVVASVVAEFCSAWGQGHRSLGCSDRILESEHCFFLVCLSIPCFLPFPLKKPIVKKINFVLHIQRECMVCAVIRACYGFAGAFLCMWGMLGGIKTGNLFWTYDFSGIICISFFRICGHFHGHFLIIGNINKVRHF